MKKDAKATKRLHDAISKLAALYPYGELEASVDPAGLLSKAADEIARLRSESNTEESKK